MLGQLYQPKGLALETARAVLEVEKPHACNMAIGCSNDCGYCYGPRFMHCSRESWRTPRKPVTRPMYLIQRQLQRPWRPQGVFLSFMTDPFIKENRLNTEGVIETLRNHIITTVATSSKSGISRYMHVRHGMTIVSTSAKFWRTWEPNTLPPKERIRLLEKEAVYAWGSLEPYPVSAIWKQDINALLEQLKFLNLIVFGKWNYDARANTAAAAEEYAEYVAAVRDFCRAYGIRLHIKSDTLKFITGR